MTALAGLALAALLWWGLKVFAQASPAQVARLLRTAGGVAALGIAALLALRGRYDMAFLVGGGGAYLLGWSSLPAPLRAFQRTTAKPGSASRVRSATLAMELDHDTGRITGEVVAGPFAGRSLDAMADEELDRLWRDCLGQDRDGARLLEAYLDRRSPGWREHAEPDADRGRQPDPKLGAMSKQEAYEVLGLQPGAEPDAIRRAHRLLMKKLHPDQGGSTYLASRVNQAKDVLLDRHR